MLDADKNGQASVACEPKVQECPRAPSRLRDSSGSFRHLASLKLQTSADAKSAGTISNFPHLRKTDEDIDMRIAFLAILMAPICLTAGGAYAETWQVYERTSHQCHFEYPRSIFMRGRRS
jgi:hypothetical protein